MSDDDKVKSMQKVWNAPWAMGELGWAFTDSHGALIQELVGEIQIQKAGQSTPIKLLKRPYSLAAPPYPGIKES